jgi:[protein-PII] uridylyltransferase
VWNGWKGQLLRTLFFETEPVLSGGHSSVSKIDRVAAAQGAFRARMADWEPDRLDRYVAKLLSEIPLHWVKIPSTIMIFQNHFCRTRKNSVFPSLHM